MSDAENCVWQGLPLCNLQLHSCLAKVGKLAEDEVVDADDEAADHTAIRNLQDLQRQHRNRARHLMQHPSPTVVHHLGTNHLGIKMEKRLLNLLLIKTYRFLRKTFRYR